MKPRLFVFLVIVALLLALGSIVAACGGNGGLTLEEYFQRIDALDEGIEDEATRLGEEFEEAIEGAETEEEVMEPFRDFFDRLLAISEDFVADFERIDPPSEVEDEHNEFLAIEGEFLDFLEDLNERAQRAESVSAAEDVTAELEGPVFTDALDREEQACLVLQAIADDNDIDVDLECEE